MKVIYTNDRKAPRMRKAKYSEHVITPELWREFKNTYSEYKKKNNNELNSLWDDISSTIRSEIITNPLGVKLGSYTGELKLQYLPYNFKAEDKNILVNIGERVNHINLTTKGKVAKLKWERRWAEKFNKLLHFFAFGATRVLEKMANQHILANPENIRIARGTKNNRQ